MESWSTISTSLLFTPRILPPPQDGQQADPPEEFSDADYWERPPACPRCRERYRPIQFDDRYVFVLPAQLVRGDVLRGESVAGGSPTFVVVGSPAGLRAPKALLERFFALQNEGKDATLAEAVRDLPEEAAGCAEAFPAIATFAVGRLPLLGGVGRNTRDFKLAEDLFAK